MKRKVRSKKVNLSTKEKLPETNFQKISKSFFKLFVRIFRIFKSSKFIQGAIFIILSSFVAFYLRIGNNFIDTVFTFVFGKAFGLFICLILFLHGLEKILHVKIINHLVFFFFFFVFFVFLSSFFLSESHYVNLFGCNIKIFRTNFLGFLFPTLSVFFEIIFTRWVFRVLFFLFSVVLFIKSFVSISRHLRKIKNETREILKDVLGLVKNKPLEKRVNIFDRIAKNKNREKTFGAEKEPQNLNENLVFETEQSSEERELTNFSFESEIDVPYYQRNILDVENWSFPKESFLKVYDTKSEAGNVNEKAEAIVKTLETFGIKVSMEEINIGPTVTQYAFKPAEGIKLSRITALGPNLTLALKAKTVRIEAPIPGRGLVGVEVPNIKSAIVGIGDFYKDLKKVYKPYELNVPLGQSISGQPTIVDITKMPHLLVAGATGTGKSVFLNSMLVSLLIQHSPETLRLILVDPKRVEFTPYDGIPHLLSPIITEPKKVLLSLKWLVLEMERRYKVLSTVGKRKVSDYNEIVPREKRFPLILLVIDELADLMMVAAKEIESSIVRLAQMARAVGIHLVLATQRPSVNVITGLIKANIPSRITFAVSSQTDSRTIIDVGGAEKLLGRGDMLFMSPDSVRLLRVQGTFVSDEEIRNVTNSWKNQFLLSIDEICNGLSDEGSDVFDSFLEKEHHLSLNFKEGALLSLDEDLDSLFEDAKRIVIEANSASTSLLQRRLKIGYARAARIMDQLERVGIISKSDGTSKPRKIIKND